MMWLMGQLIILSSQYDPMYFVLWWLWVVCTQPSTSQHIPWCVQAGTPSGTFTKSFGFIRCLHQEKSPQKAFGTGGQNLEVDWINLLSLFQADQPHSWPLLREVSTWCRRRSLAACDFPVASHEASQSSARLLPHPGRSEEPRCYSLLFLFNPRRPNAIDKKVKPRRGKKRLPKALAFSEKLRIYHNLRISLMLFEGDAL